MGPLLFGLAVLVLFVLGGVALLYLASGEEPGVPEGELEALMRSPEASASLPPYYYEATTRPAALSLVTEPAGALVTLNAEALGPTPRTLDALRPGYYTIRLQHPDYAPLDTTLYLASGAVQRLDVVLSPLTADSPRPPAPTRGRVERRGAAPGGSAPAGRFARASPETVRRVWHTGSLSVTSEPSGARVLVDGQPRGRTPLSVNGLRPGSYTVPLPCADTTPVPGCRASSRRSITTTHTRAG